jgi:hypothetical protein
MNSRVLSDIDGSFQSAKNNSKQFNTFQMNSPNQSGSRQKGAMNNEKVGLYLK